MDIRGRVHNGVVVVEGGLALPEGTAVTVLCSIAPNALPCGQRQRVSLPLVPSGRPGQRPLTSERVAELLDEDGVSA